MVVKSFFLPQTSGTASSFFPGSLNPGVTEPEQWLLVAVRVAEPVCLDCVARILMAAFLYSSTNQPPRV